MGVYSRTYFGKKAQVSSETFEKGSMFLERRELNTFFLLR
jgi:hypothetical protein